MSFENGWFYEKNRQWPGQCLGLEVKQILRQQKTKFQDLVVFESTSFGKVLVLDGVVQLTEKDECSYQEMLAHLPMCSSKNAAENVLIVGGGDGGVLREVCKHAFAATGSGTNSSTSTLKKVVMCEIDAGVLDAAEEFFPEVSIWLKRARRVDGKGNVLREKPETSAVGGNAGEAHKDEQDSSGLEITIVVDDAIQYVKDQCQSGSFDVVIIDSSDPDGPAEGLFQPAFYEQVARILKPESGVLAAQGECLWIHQDILKQVYFDCGKFFKSKAYASVQVPTYPCGQISLFLAANFQTELKEPRRSLMNNTVTEEKAGAVEEPAMKKQKTEQDGSCKADTKEDSSTFRYYSPEMHRAAFALPQFVKDLFREENKPAAKDQEASPASSIATASSSVEA
ncbi:unnamed protein product [Amoebophrya sp. A25]|nr:unnamed protein product [Amoebophrya sp. A25]|eukprot:GSA25T00019245001.1